MSRQDILRLFCLIFFANNCVNHSSCVPREHYKEYKLSSLNVCKILGKPPINELKNSAMIVKSDHMFDPWVEGRKNIRCKFIVKTAKGDGLFAVIQRMYFRKNETHCIDYVQFRRKDHQLTQKFCGSFERNKMKDYLVVEPENGKQPSESLLMPTYAEFNEISYKTEAELETEIFVSNKTLQKGEQLSLEIAYTPFKNCSKVDPKEYTEPFCDTRLPEHYFCDGIYNCVPDVCSDEDNCPNNSNNIISTGTGTTVTIGAVTTVILCFFIFVMCLWICKRSQKLYCTVTELLDEPGPNDVTIPHLNVVSGATRETERSANSTVPSAPIDVAVPSAVTDKDLPPSYESLFPEHSNPVRS